MSAREVGGSNDSSSMSRPRKTPPARMRDYRIEAQLREEPLVPGIAEELLRAAHDTRMKLHLAVPTAAGGLDDTAPALTEPLDTSAPQGMRWILIGSLMEDLRRIRHELGAQSG